MKKAQNSFNKDHRNIIFLNYHSTVADYLGECFQRQDLRIKAITFDSHVCPALGSMASHLAEDALKLDSTLAWQSDCTDIDIAATAYNLNELNRAVTVARLNIMTWLIHRENLGEGLSELNIQTITASCMRNGLALLNYAKPSMVFSILAPCTPFDICLMTLACELSIKTISLSEINLKGFFYLTANQFNHFAGVMKTREVAVGLVNQPYCELYLNDLLKTPPYYIKSDFFSNDASFTVDRARLRFMAYQAFAAALVLYLKVIFEFFYRIFRRSKIRYTTAKLRRFGFLSGRDLKHINKVQATKEISRSFYLHHMSNNMSSTVDEKSVIILLDYYPEITRYPIGGDDYFYSNYFYVANILKQRQSLGLSKTSKIYVKEHPAMLQISTHSHPRRRMIELVEENSAQFLSPIQKTTSIITCSKDCVIITGVSNAGVEASLLNCKTITTSNPWWLCLPNTYQFDLSRNLLIEPKRNMQKVEIVQENKLPECVSVQAAEAYYTFVNRYCIDCGLSMAEIDTYASPLSIQQKNALETVAIITAKGLI